MTSDPYARPEAPSRPGTDLLEREEVREQVEPGDHERFAHFVRKDRILKSAVAGTPVIALCGKIWVPTRDPNRFPMCPVCKEIYQTMQPGEPDQ